MWAGLPLGMRACLCLALLAVALATPFSLIPHGSKAGDRRVTVHKPCDASGPAPLSNEATAGSASGGRRMTTVATCPLPQRDIDGSVRYSGCSFIATPHGVVEPGCVAQQDVDLLRVSGPGAGTPGDVILEAPIPLSPSASSPHPDDESGVTAVYDIPLLLLPSSLQDGTGDAARAVSVAFRVDDSGQCAGPDAVMTWSYTLACTGVSVSHEGKWWRAPSLRRRMQSNTLVDGPYIQSTGPTSTLIVWRTSSPDIGVVMLGTNPTSLAMQFSTANPTTDPAVQVTGLKAMTTYYYSIGSPSVTYQGSAANTFATLPALGSAKALRAYMLGDPGTGIMLQSQVLAAGLAWMASTKLSANLFFFLGDNAYLDGTDAQYSSWVFQFYKDQLVKWPMWALLGNHDDSSTLTSSGTGVGPYFSRFLTPQAGESGGVPSGSGAYYSVDYGNIHIVCLDSYLSSNSKGSPMLTWLAKDLAALKPATKWLVGLWHHGPYSKGSLDSDTDSGMASMRQNVLPIMEAAGVDIVVGGHSHVYERSQFLNGFYGKSATYSQSYVIPFGSGTVADPYLKPLGRTPNAGQVSVITGSAGQFSTTTFGLMHPANVVLPATGSSRQGANVAGSFVLDISGNNLTGTFISSTGAVLDQFVISKVAHMPSVSPTISESPTVSPSLPPSVSPSFAAPPSPSPLPTPPPSQSPVPGTGSGSGSGTGATVAPVPTQAPSRTPHASRVAVAAAASTTVAGLTTSQFQTLLIGVVAGCCLLAVLSLGAMLLMKRRRRRSSSNSSKRRGYSGERERRGRSPPRHPSKSRRSDKDKRSPSAKQSPRVPVSSHRDAEAPRVRMAYHQQLAPGVHWAGVGAPLPSEGVRAPQRAHSQGVRAPAQKVTARRALSSGPPDGSGRKKIRVKVRKSAPVVIKR